MLEILASGNIMNFLRALTAGAFGITIFLAVLVEGMAVSRADVEYLFRKPDRLIRTVLSMNVFGPIVAITVCSLFALHPAVIVALVTLSMTPVGETTAPSSPLPRSHDIPASPSRLRS